MLNKEFASLYLRLNSFTDININAFTYSLLPQVFLLALMYYPLVRLWRLWLVEVRSRLCTQSLGTIIITSSCRVISNTAAMITGPMPGPSTAIFHEHYYDCASYCLILPCVQIRSVMLSWLRLRHSSSFSLSPLPVSVNNGLTVSVQGQVWDLHVTAVIKSHCSWTFCLLSLPSVV